MMKFNKNHWTRFWNSSLRYLLYSSEPQRHNNHHLKWKCSLSRSLFISLFYILFCAKKNSFKQKSTKEFFFTTLYEPDDHHHHLLSLARLFAESRTEILSLKEFDAKARRRRRKKKKRRIKYTIYTADGAEKRKMNGPISSPRPPVLLLLLWWVDESKKTI